MIQTQTPSDTAVEQEIERLKQSDAVKLALREMRYNRQRKQYHRTLMWCVQIGDDIMAIDMAAATRKHQRLQGISILRHHEQRGQQLMAQGIAEEMFPDLILDDTMTRRREATK